MLGVVFYLGDEISSYIIVLGVKARCRHNVCVIISHLRYVQQSSLTLASRISQYGNIKSQTSRKHTNIKLTLKEYPHKLNS